MLSETMLRRSPALSLAQPKQCTASAYSLMVPPTGSSPAHTSKMLHDHPLSHELGLLTDVAILTADQEEED